MKAMIFAAGLGTRLSPLTDTTPKALIEVGGKPALRHAIDNIVQAGITDIVVNVHHHAGQVKAYLAANPVPGVRIRISDESDRLLDTGGGLMKALPLLGTDEPVLLHNADIITDVDLPQMIDVFVTNPFDAMLLISKVRKSSRQLLFDPEDARMVGWKNLNTGEIRTPFGEDLIEWQYEVSFQGVHTIGPRLLKALQKRADTEGIHPFSITQFYIDECREYDIRAFIPSTTPYRWADIGTPDKLARAREMFTE